MNQTSSGAARVAPDLFVLPADGKYVVYAPLVRAAFETSGAGVQLLGRIARGPADEPAGGPVASFWRLLRQLGILDPHIVLEPSGEKTGPFAPTGVTLFLSTNCNLRCTYCYASAGETPSRTMKWETAKAALDYVGQNAIEVTAPKIDLMFHGGGEPTVAWPVLVRAVGYMRTFCTAHGIALSVSLSTNGVLKESQVDYITRHCSSANVSYDGLPAVQDRQRPLVVGGSSSAAVLRTLQRFDAARFPYGVRMTVTERSVDSIVQSVDWLLRHCRPSAIQIEPSFQMGRCTALTDASPEVDQFLAGYRACRARAVGSGVRITYSGANLDSVTSHFCGVTQDGFAVTTEGVVSSCYEAFLEEDPRGRAEFFYGRLDLASGRWVFDEARLRALRGKTVRGKTFCQDCFARWHCAGDCHHRAEPAPPGAQFQGTPRCRLNQELTRDVLLERVRAGGGIWKERVERGSDADQPSVS